MNDQIVDAETEIVAMKAVHDALQPICSDGAAVLRVVNWAVERYRSRYNMALNLEFDKNIMRSGSK